MVLRVFVEAPGPVGRAGEATRLAWMQSQAVTKRVGGRPLQPALCFTADCPLSPSYPLILIFFFFAFFKAMPAVYGSSQATS